MKTNVRGADRRRRATRPAVFLSAALLMVGAVAATPASAQLLPPLPPLPTSTTGLDLNDPVDDVTGLLTDVPDQLGSIVEDTTASLQLPGTDPEPGNPGPGTQNPVQAPVTGSWSADNPPAGLQNAVPAVSTRVSDARYRRSLSYGAALSEGIRAAVGRAASLAGPLAAPMLLALVAIGLLAVAARGPGRLAKVEEERHTVRERRSYRL